MPDIALATSTAGSSSSWRHPHPVALQIALPGFALWLPSALYRFSAQRMRAM
jgi:hypothetical protein